MIGSVSAFRPGLPARTASKATDELEQRIEMLETLSRSRGGSELQEKIKQTRALLAEARKPDLTFSDQTKTEVRDYLKGSQVLPQAFDTHQNEQLEVFGKLVQRGMHFRRSGQELPPDQAFLGLIAKPYHALDEQICFQCHLPQGIRAVTLRPQYLPAVNFFLERTLEGEVFYRKPDAKSSMFDPQPNRDGYVEIKTVDDFVSHYHDHPEQAVVRFGGVYTTREQIQSDRDYIAALAANHDSNLIDDLGDHLMVGGVMLDKNPDW